MFKKIMHKKAKMVTYVMILFVCILALFGGLNIYNSCKIINDQVNSNLEFLADGIRKSSNRYFRAAQEEIEHCKNVLELTIATEDSRKITDKSNKYSTRQLNLINNYLNTQLSPILLYSTKHITGLNGIYFHFDYNLFDTKEFQGIWYIKSNKTNKYVRISNGYVSEMLPETRSDLKWYYLPKKLKRGVWSEPYIDSDLKVTMITYSTPVYIENKFLGIMGTDISLEELEKFLLQFKVYHNGKVYLLDEDKKIIFAPGYATKASSDTINNDLHNYLKTYSPKKILSPSEKEVSLIKSHNKIFAVTALYNGFIIVLEIPTKELYGEINKLVTTTSLSLLLAILISILIAIEAYAKIKRINEELMHKEKLISMGTMTAEIAHEINNPLGYIGCNIDTMKKFIAKFKLLIKAYEEVFNNMITKKTSAEDELECIEELKKQTKMDYVMESIDELIDETKDGLKKVSETVVNLKNFSKNDSHENKKEEDLASIINEAFIILGNKISKEIKVTAKYEDIPPVLCNKNQIKQVLVNMIENASHSINEKNPTEKEIIINLCKNGKYAQIEIEDNGTGIEKEKLNKIFDAFFTTKELGKGTGLGLSIAHDIIVNKHDGDILVESKKGKGTKFLIKLPYTTKK